MKAKQFISMFCSSKLLNVCSLHRQIFSQTAPSELNKQGICTILFIKVHDVFQIKNNTVTHGMA